MDQRHATPQPIRREPASSQRRRFRAGRHRRPLSPATVFGGYTQRAGATLEIDFFPDSNCVSDIVVVTDTAVLGGALALNLNGTVPDPSTNYTIFDALSIAGAFANVANGQRLTTGDGLGSFVVNYGAGSAFDPTQIVLSNFLAAAPRRLQPERHRRRRRLHRLAQQPRQRHVAAERRHTRRRPGRLHPLATHFGQGICAGAAGTESVSVPEPTMPVLLLLAGLVSFARPLRSRPAARYFRGAIRIVKQHRPRWARSAKLQPEMREPVWR